MNLPASRQRALAVNVQLDDCRPHGFGFVLLSIGEEGAVFTGRTVLLAGTWSRVLAC